MSAFLKSLLSLIVGGFLTGVFIASGMAGALTVAILLAFASARVENWFDKRKR